MEHQLLAFIALATLLTVTPGADMALVTRNVLHGGVRSGLETSAGILTGLVVWAALAGLGVAAVLAASAAAFTVLKIAGAAYLIYLGLVSIFRRHDAAEPGAPEAVTLPRSFSAHYRQGLLSNLLNVKVGVFYTTFFPQFIEPGQSVVALTALLAAVHLAISITWLVFYAWLVAVLRGAISRPRVRRAMDRVTGTVLVGFGLRVAKEAR